MNFFYFVKSEIKFMPQYAVHISYPQDISQLYYFTYANGINFINISNRRTCGDKVQRRGYSKSPSNT